MQTQIGVLWYILLSIALTACGSGGDDDPKESPTPIVEVSPTPLVVAPTPAPTAEPTVFPVPTATTIEDFFLVPWPSDTRLLESGSTILSSGLNYTVWFPHARPVGLVGLQESVASSIAYHQGAFQMDEHAFGLNSGVFFTLPQGVNPNSLPSHPLQTLPDNATIMLVNLDGTAADTSLDRIPLLVDYKSQGTTFRANNTLTLMPYRGFTLQEGSRYAAIVFNAVQNAQGQPLGKEGFFQTIEEDWHSSMYLTEQQHTAWQQHKALVEQYVAAYTQWQPSDIAAFSVYSTQTVSRRALYIKAALAKMTDDNVLNMVVYDQVSTDMNPEIVGNCTFERSVLLRGSINLPRWQDGKYPYVLNGGNFKIEVNGENQLIIPKVHETVPFQVWIPCNVPSAKPFMVSQPGSTSLSENIGSYVDSYFLNSSYPNDLIVIGVGDYMTSEERWQAGTFDAYNLAILFGIMSSDISISKFTGALRNNFINPVAGRGNLFQVAAETYILKRLAENLQILASDMLTASDLDSANLTLTDFAVDTQRAGLYGFSQGGVNGPLSMLMDDGFQYAYWGSMTALQIPLIADSPPIQDLIRAIFPQIQADEMDQFHPIAHLLQAINEPMDAVNYTRLLSPNSLLVTAGENARDWRS